MLVLSRKVGESLRIGENIWVVVVRTETGRVRLGIVAPHDVQVIRAELDPLFFQPHTDVADTAPWPVRKT